MMFSSSARLERRLLATARGAMSITSGPTRRPSLSEDRRTPRRLKTCEFLIRLHEQRGDKIIVFSDNIFILKARMLLLR